MCTSYFFMQNTHKKTTYLIFYLFSKQKLFYQHNSFHQSYDLLFLLPPFDLPNRIFTCNVHYFPLCLCLFNLSNIKKQTVQIKIKLNSQGKTKMGEILRSFVHQICVSKIGTRLTLRHELRFQGLCVCQPGHAKIQPWVPTPTLSNRSYKASLEYTSMRNI